MVHHSRASSAFDQTALALPKDPSTGALGAVLPWRMVLVLYDTNAGATVELQRCAHITQNEGIGKKTSRVPYVVRAGLLNACLHYACIIALPKFSRTSGAFAVVEVLVKPACWLSNTGPCCFCWCIKFRPFCTYLELQSRTL